MASTAEAQAQHTGELELGTVFDFGGYVDVISHLFRSRLNIRACRRDPWSSTWSLRSGLGRAGGDGAA